ncbi:MAG: DUF58 domain-containing protein [Planctomycetes bacterium]|nr:DUF58 domain-containing protein [Planctomycetota bacterium]
MEGFLERIDTLDARQFHIAIKKLADSLSYGTDASPYLGPGIEYVQSRPYQWGDPIRAIDWRVTARTGRVFVKEYEAPKRMPCYLLVDTSASMTTSSTARSKYAVAVHIAGGLAFACLDRVSPVGVLTVGERALRIRPTLSKDEVMRWMLALRRFRYDEHTLLSKRIAELGPRLDRRALIIVLSDLHEPAALGALRRLAQNHDVVVLRLEDPGELSLKGAGFLRVREAESGRPFTTHGRRSSVDRTACDESLKRAGIDQVVLRTDQPFVHRLRHFFQARALVGRGAR